MKLLIGKTLSFNHNPFYGDLDKSVSINNDGGVLVQNGLIKEVGNSKEIIRKYPKVKIFNYQKSLILAGFIDAHMHYPQTSIIASYGKRLIDWLNQYTFPEEERFKNCKYAQEISSFTLNICLRNGTTTVASFCTSHLNSVDMFFNEAKKRNMRVVGGKVCMDRNAPEGLLDNVKSSYDDSEKLINKWHKNERIIYAISPRFAPTSSPEQLNTLGDLWENYPDCLLQTHISEQKEEIEWVKKLFPNFKDYLDVYDQFRLLKKGTILGHAIHLNERERKRIKEIGASLVHCPTSNFFIGSGLFDLEGLSKEKQKIGLATDTGGGTSFSMLKTMSAAYEVAQMRNFSVHPSQLIWMATQGAAEALNIDKYLGNLETGKEADIVIIDLYSTPLIRKRSLLAENIWDAIFPTIILGDERAIQSVWVKGKEIDFKNL